MWGVQEAGDAGPLTWRPNGVREHPGTETGMARNLLEAGVRMLRQSGKAGKHGDTRPKG